MPKIFANFVRLDIMGAFLPKMAVMIFRLFV